MFLVLLNIVSSLFMSNVYLVLLTGSFECQCDVGFVIENAFTCVDRDECALGMNNCNKHRSIFFNKHY